MPRIFRQAGGLGLEPVGGSPEELGQFQKAEIREVGQGRKGSERQAGIIVQANLTLRDRDPGCRCAPRVGERTSCSR